MDDDFGPDYGQQHQAEQERWEMTVGALQNCLKAGAKEEDVMVLAREAGIDWRQVKCN